jgi:hypothetical protein
MRITHSLIAFLVTAAALAACSPGTLPGSPSPILVAGGGGKYNGSITYRRVGGNYAITETAQPLTLSLSLRDVNQIVGRFETGESSGSVQGVLTGNMSNGTFDATVLILTTARQGGTTSNCEGRGQITGLLSGLNLTWTTGSIAYDNCPGLAISAQAQAVAVSPIPDSSATAARLVITVLGGATVPRGSCASGIAGYPFTIEMSETAGVNLTFETRFRIEERRGSGVVSSTELDMPFYTISGGTRRTYTACSPVAGTYQAFFSGIDANGNRIRVASPVITLGP